MPLLQGLDMQDYLLPAILRKALLCITFRQKKMRNAPRANSFSTFNQIMTGDLRCWQRSDY